MAKKNQQVYPMELTPGPPKADVESDEVRNKKGAKKIAYYVAFGVLQITVLLVIALTFMNIKNPKFLFRSVEIEDLSYTTNPSSPSFNIRLNAEVGVQNTNFGHFKFHNTTIRLIYRGVLVGEARFAKGRARARSTKKKNVRVDVTSDRVLNNSSLVSDLSSGFLTLTGRGKLSGKVHLMKMMTKRKSAQMNCSIDVNLAEKAIQDFICM